MVFARSGCVSPQVLPREWGTQLHPLFFLQASFWSGTTGGGVGGRLAGKRGGALGDHNEERDALEGEWTTEGDEDSLLEAPDGGEAEVRESRQPTLRRGPSRSV